jgi:TATA-box binding protein (TBP) (component of TFIID and TFIIIB)
MTPRLTSDGQVKSRAITKVVNVVATADLGQSVDLARVGWLDGFSYEPESYPCAYLKRKPMFGKVTIFGTGKLISVGTKSVSQARHDLMLAARVLAFEVDLREVRPKVTVRNIVTRSDLGYPLNLLRFHLDHEDSVYEPEVFPAVLWKPEDGDAHLLLFSSGKVVGALKRMKDAGRISRWLTKNMADYRSADS